MSLQCVYWNFKEHTVMEFDIDLKFQYREMVILENEIWRINISLHYNKIILSRKHFLTGGVTDLFEAQFSGAATGSATQCTVLQQF